MTFNQLKEYHLKTLEVILRSEKVIHGIITSHSLNAENREVLAISLMGQWAIERIDCKEIKEIRILE
jgi:hypothetical protein